MKASKFSDAQKAFIIEQSEDGTPVSEICRKAKISQATYFNWKKKYAGLLLTEMIRLKDIEDENRWLKKIVADLTLYRKMLQDAIRRKICCPPPSLAHASTRCQTKRSDARTGSRDAQRLGGLDTNGVFAHRI